MRQDIFTVLIADDSLSARNLLEAILKPEGFRFLFSGTGEETLELALREKPDLLLLDVVLPDLSGFEVCRQIRENPYLAPMPILLITGLTDRDSRIEGYSAGADAFISKPLDPLEVLARVRSIKRQNRFLPYLYHKWLDLPNEILFRDYCDMLIRAGAPDLSFSILALRMDNAAFLVKYLRKAEDLNLLRRMAEDIKRADQEVALLAYQSDGTFFLLLMEQDSHKVQSFAKELAARLTGPKDIAGEDMMVRAAVGGASYPTHGKSTQDLMEKARLVLDEASNSGQDALLYDIKMEVTIHRKLKLSAAIYKAIEMGEFILHYQPQISLSDGKIRGLEALIRWNSSQYGYKLPAFFIPEANASGAILPLGEWVLEEGLSFLKSLEQEGLEVPVLAINVSPLQFADLKMEEKFTEKTRTIGISPGNLKVEITEDALIADPALAAKRLGGLKKKGFRISIDDFGTGYASLAYLRDFPADEIKIDRSFTMNLSPGSYEHILTEHFVSLIQDLGMESVAEGVETQAQLDLLEKMGCHRGQGYYFSRPLPPEEVKRLLQEQPFMSRGTQGCCGWRKQPAGSGSPD